MFPSVGQMFLRCVSEWLSIGRWSGVVVGQSLSTQYELGPPERRAWTMLSSLAQLTHV